MPFAGFPNFGGCMNDSGMKKKYPKKETRQKVCGKLQSLHEKKHEINEIKKEILEEKRDMLRIQKELENNKKWIQKCLKN